MSFSPIVERMILTGRATKYNKVHGLSAAGIIRCPKDRWIIVTSILWYNFIDDIDTVPKCLDLQLTMTSANNKQNYVFRNEYNLDAVTSILQSRDPVQMDVLDIHKSDVILTIAKFTDIAINEGFDFAPLPTQAQQQLPPNGYGISTNVLRGLQFPTNGSQVFPAGLDALGGSAIVANGRGNEDYKTDVQAANNALASPIGQENCPLINFTYVTVNSKDLENL